MSANKQGSTVKERQGKKHIVPEKIPNGRACPPIEVQAHNAHVDFYKRYQKKQAQNASKAFDLLQWQLDDMHKVLNPKNKGKTTTEWVENPDFDQSKKDTPTKNPFFIEQTVAAYQPWKYKPNQVKDVAKEVLSVNDDHIKQLQAMEKEEQRLEAQARRDALKAGEVVEEVVEVADTSSLISLDFDESSIN